MNGTHAGEQSTVDMSNAPLGFGLSVVAGAATSLGAGIVFLPCVAMSNSLFFAGAIGVSVGVMVYVSFIEIQPECWALYEAGGTMSGNKEGGMVYFVGTLTFMCGILLYYILDGLVHWLDHDGSLHELNSLTQAAAKSPQAMGGKSTSAPAANYVVELDAQPSKVISDSEVTVHTNPSCEPEPLTLPKGQRDCPADEKEAVHEGSQLLKMGYMTALAITLHNIPEGLVAFIGTLEDPAVGGALAVAIGIHNIPEGICIAVPIFYSTGSKWKGFMWATLAGFAEPVGAALAWAVFAKSNSATANGALFGLVAGIMVAISFREMLPNALNFDPENKVTAHCVFLGMGIMAASLVLFNLDA